MFAQSETGRTPAFGADVLLRLATALWVYDFAERRIIWANPAALRLWSAETVDELARRDMSREMSAAVEARLAQHRDDFLIDPAREIRESWTLYPNGHPFRVSAVLRRCELASGALGMLVEASVEEDVRPETVRSADALLYTQAMIALFSEEGEGLYMNTAYRAAFGPGEHTFGRDFVAPADLLEFVEALRERGEHRATVQVRTRLGEAWHDIHAVRCKDAVSGNRAFFVNATDVTDARLYQERLAEARDEAEEATRLKSQFLHSVSHEMRTPLNGILGMTSLMVDTPLGPQQRDMLRAVQGSGERLLELVENVLELVAIDSGCVEIARTRFSPALLIEAAVASVNALAEEKGLRILSHLGPVVGREIDHDPARLRLVIRHLLLNAIKFTERGFVSARARVLPDGGLHVEIADSGIGIPADKRGEVFSRFYQLDGSQTRAYQGVGVGLAICKELVTLWGGEIGVESDFGRGSIFWFTIPPADAPKRLTDPSKGGGPALRIVAGHRRQA